MRRSKLSVQELDQLLYPHVLVDVVRLQTHMPHVSVTRGAQEADLAVQTMRPRANQTQQFPSPQLPSNP